MGKLDDINHKIKIILKAKEVGKITNKGLIKQYQKELEYLIGYSFFEAMDGYSDDE